MRCYNCGAELGKGDNCQNCGTNVKVYKKDFDGIQCLLQ